MTTELIIQQITRRLVIIDTLSVTHAIMYYIMCHYNHSDAELWR